VGLGALLTRNLVYDVTNTQSGATDTYTIVTDGGPGMYPDWSAGAYRGLLGIPAADQAMMLIAGLLGRVPWCGYRKVAGKRPVKLDPEPTILDYPAGSFEIPLRTWHGWAMDRMAHGNGIGLVAARTPDGWPSAYTPVSAEMVSVARAGQGWMPAGFAEGEIVWYIGGRYYHQYEVIHFKGPCKPGDLRGMGVLENHFATLDRSRKLDRQASDVDANAVPTGLLKSLKPGHHAGRGDRAQGCVARRPADPHGGRAEPLYRVRADQLVADRRAAAGSPAVHPDRMGQHLRYRLVVSSVVTLRRDLREIWRKRVWICCDTDDLVKWSWNSSRP
jgi:hypothetical protein